MRARAAIGGGGGGKGPASKANALGEDVAAVMIAERRDTAKDEERRREAERKAEEVLKCTRFTGTKSTDTDAEGAALGGQEGPRLCGARARAGGPAPRALGGAGTHFTCCTGTKVQILTKEGVRAREALEVQALVYLLYRYKRTNTDAAAAGAGGARRVAPRKPGQEGGAPAEASLAAQHAAGNEAKSAEISLCLSF
jgi:hypothetical protein